MNPVPPVVNAIPLVVPIRLQEAAAVAELIWQIVRPSAEVGRPRGGKGSGITEAHRSQLAARLAALSLPTLRVLPWSLVADPVAHSAFYLAVDVTPAEPLAAEGNSAVADSPLSPAPFQPQPANKPQPASFLLHLALSSSTATGLFPGSILVGRLPLARGLESALGRDYPSGLELVVNAIPFADDGAARLATLAEQVDRTLLPRSSGSGTGLLLAATGDFETAFAGFRALQKRYGFSCAAVDLGDALGLDAQATPADPAAASAPGNPHNHSQHRLAILRAATRHGLRDGYLVCGPLGGEGVTRTNLYAGDLEQVLAGARLVQAQAAATGQRLADFNLRLPPLSRTRLTEPALLKPLLQALKEAGLPPLAVEVQLGQRADCPYPQTRAELEHHASTFGGLSQALADKVAWSNRQHPLEELEQRVRELAELARAHGAVLLVQGHPHDVANLEYLAALASGCHGRLIYVVPAAAVSRLPELGVALRG